jgi:hypothetical protein
MEIAVIISRIPQIHPPVDMPQRVQEQKQGNKITATERKPCSEKKLLISPVCFREIFHHSAPRKERQKNAVCAYSVTTQQEDPAKQDPYTGIPVDRNVHDSAQNFEDSLRQAAIQQPLLNIVSCLC